MVKDTWKFVQKEAARAMLANYKLGVADSWVKALTELVTNSHQNYQDMLNDPKFPKSSEKPRIVIFADAVNEKFSVRDLGTGIAANGKELEKLLISYSGYIEQSHTPQGRSSFGRGMSDVLFRKKEYENQIISHKDGKCIAAMAKWTKEGPTFSEDTKISDEQIKSELPGHGTLVTFHWFSKYESQDFPSKKKMLDALSRYYELKNVLNDQQIDVILLYSDGQETPTPEKLKFVNYENNAKVLGTKSNIPLDTIDRKFFGPNYDISIISAKICRANTALTQEKGASRTGGLFIEGEYGQVYDLTLFEHEKNFRSAALKIIGTVVLSADAKKYMDDCYTSSGETILTRTREGFRTQTKFFRALKKKLEPWLVSILEAESQTSSSSSSDLFEDAIKLLNDIAMELLEAKNLETGDDLDGRDQKKKKKEPKLPVTIEFSPKSPKIEQGVLCKIFLRINAERIRPGTNISFTKEGADRNHYEIKYETKRVPKPNKKGLSKIPIYVKCNELKAQAEIRAVTSLSNTGRVEKYCDMICVPEEETGWTPTEYLEFSPKSLTTETNIHKRINLYAHQTLDPGSKIKIEFSCNRTEPSITFLEDGNQKITTQSHSFDIQVPDDELDENAYRKIPLTFFTGTENGFEGKITASSSHAKVLPAICEIKVEDETTPSGGLLSGWKFVDESDYPMYAWYEPADTKVYLNLAIPHVKAVLGKNKEEAESRCDQLQEAQVFVATAMMEAFFDDVVARLYKSRKEVFDQIEPTYQEAHDAMVKKRQGIVTKYGQAVLESIAPNIRTKTSGKSRIMDFKKENIQFKFWDLESQKDIVPPLSFNQLEEFRGKTANMTPVHFEVNGQTFEVGVYDLDGKFVVRMHNYDRDGKYKAVMSEIDSMKQIFRPPKQNCKKIDLDDPVFSAVRIAGWVRQPDKNNRLIHEHIDYDQFDKIIEPPELNHANYLLESSPNWISPQGDPLIQYAKYSDIDQSHANDNMKDKLACFVSNRNTIQMAKMFVRTHVAPVFVQFNDLVRAFKDVVAECEDAKCGEHAEGYEQILTKKGFHREGENMVINKLCRNCQ